MSKVSKKFSIVKTLDFEKLNEEIEKYICMNCGEEKPYIFMNDETIDEISIQLQPTPLYPCVYYKNKNSYIKYNDCRVFPDNTLGFGEIEIR